MFINLALRNVRRQIGNYLIYFITVTLTVALMFAVNNTIYSQELQKYAESLDELRSGLTMLSVLVALIVAFVLGYATSFMLKLRKREFGTYLTMGMSRKNILTIFLFETLSMCAAALGAGILIGLFLYQGLMFLISGLMDITFAFSAYSLNGLVLTVVLVTAVFLLASLTSGFYLKRVSIYDLIHGDQVVEKNVKHPVIWFIITLLSLSTIIFGFVLFDKAVENIQTTADGSLSGTVNGIMLISAGVILFHIGLSRSIVYLMLKKRSFCCRGTNTFTLRQLSGRLRASSLMAGILAFLITFAVAGANVSFLHKTTLEGVLNKGYPFDILGIVEEEEEGTVSIEKAEGIIGDYAEIKEKIPYKIYETKDSFLHSYTMWSGERYSSLKDSVISESDFNRLWTVLGNEPLRLNDSYRVFRGVSQAECPDFTEIEWKLNGKTYYGEGVTEPLPYLGYYYILAVVPDEAVEGLSVQFECEAFQLKNQNFDIESLNTALSHTVQNEDYSWERNDFRIRELGRRNLYSEAAVLIISILYFAVVFLFMAMAVLALKILSGLSEDKQRYGILYRLGVGQKEQSKTLFRQIFSFFFLPFAFPILTSIPVGAISAKIMKYGEFRDQAGEVYVIAASVAAVVMALYVLYFTATYLIAKRNVVSSSES